MRVKNLSILFFAAIAISFFASCSEADEDAPSKTGREMAARYKSLLTGSQSARWMLPCDDLSDTFMAQVADASAADKLCYALIGDDSWTLGDGVYRLPDSYGHVSVRHSGEDGFFISMAFNVQGMDAVELRLVSHEYLVNQSNYLVTPSWVFRTKTCRNCGWTTEPTGGTEVCLICGGTDFSQNY